MAETFIPFRSGLMLVGTPMSRDPGSCLGAYNHEIHLDGGYKRIEGYTLYDGSETPAAVPGSGPIRGVVMYEHDVYAFRDNAAGTECVMHKATSGGWTTVTTPTLSPGGTYEFYVYNFYGASGLRKLYGVDGINKAFEFDGSTFTQITTGMTPDAPTHVIGFKYHLFLSFPGGSVQHSSIGDPLTWTPITGAGELGVGDEVTGFSEEVGGTLFIFADDRIETLTGSSSANWDKKPYSSDSGAKPGSIQRIGQSLFVSNAGIVQLGTTQAYGDFKSVSASIPIDPLYELYKTNWSVTTTYASHTHNQYRIFYDNAAFFIVSFSGGQVVGITTGSYPVVMTCSTVGEDATGKEWVYHGGEDGKVYQVGGNSFDGAPIPAFIRTQYHHYRTPTARKAFRRIFFEAQCLGDTAPELHVRPTYDYGADKMPLSELYPMDIIAGTQGYWSGSLWDNFHWSVPMAPDEPLHVAGVGRNMSLLISTYSATADPVTFYGMVVVHNRRGTQR